MTPLSDSVESPIVCLGRAPKSVIRMVVPGAPGVLLTFKVEWENAGFSWFAAIRSHTKACRLLPGFFVIWARGAAVSPLDGINELSI